MTTRLPLSELFASGIRLRPTEAVAIVGEICRQRAARVLPGLPSAGVIRLTSHGEIVIEGPVPAGEDAVSRAAQLLESLLADFDAPAEYRASGALRLVIARGLGTLDLPPYASLEDFCAALVRFSPLDARETVAALVAAWNHAHAEPERSESEDAVALAPRRGIAALAMWIGAPAAAAVLGYVLALPFAGTARAPRVPAIHPAPTQALAQGLPVVPPLPPATDEAPSPAAKPERVRLIQSSAYSPSYAASGAVYFHDQRTGASALKLAETGDDGSVTKVTSILADRARNFHPRPSPDGKQIAFDSDREGERAVYVADADGTNVRRISGPGFASVPSWSPDGREVAFVRGEAAKPSVWNLWIASSDGSKLRRVTHHHVGQAWGGSWFPDGKRIAYSVEDRLVILDLASGRARVLHSPLTGRLVRTPAVSPDGQRIIFQVRHDGAWIADVASGRMQRVLTDPTAEEYTWAPDGHHVAFHSHRTGAWSVWVMAL